MTLRFKKGYGVCCICKFEFNETIIPLLIRCIILHTTECYEDKYYLFSILVSIGCGQTSSENITYILGGDDFMDADANCRYSLCRCSADVCRIKLEFNVSYVLDDILCYKLYNYYLAIYFS